MTPTSEGANIVWHSGLEAEIIDKAFDIEIGYDVDKPTFGASVGAPLLKVDYMGSAKKDRFNHSIGFSFASGLKEKRYLSFYFK